MRVLIATPTTGGTVATAYAQSLAAATAAIHGAGGTYRLMTVDGADVVIARTLLAHAFLADESATHILFVDSDMAVERAVFSHFLALDVAIVGAAYAERRLDLGAFAAAMAEAPDEPRARALASTFNIRVAPGQVEVKGHVCEVEGFGFGCVLIARAVFEAMVERGIASAFVSAKLRSAGLTGDIWDFFAPIRREDGDWMSEDYSFCARTARLGDVPLLAYVGPGVGHVGSFTYGAPYVERLKAGKG